MKTDLRHLQNGSDVRGVAMAVPGGGAVDLTEEACERIAGAFVRWLAAPDRTSAGGPPGGRGT